MKQETLFILSGREDTRTIFKELESDSRIKILYGETILDQKSIIYTLMRVHYSYKIYQRIKLPFKGMWKKFLSLNQINFDINTRYKILFTNNSLFMTELTNLLKLKKQYHVDFYLYLVDSMGKRDTYKVQSYIDSDIFTEIISFDEKDSKQYGFKYFPHPIPYVKPRKSAIQQDIYFLGVAKGRSKHLIELSNFFKSNGVTQKLLVASSNGKEKLELKQHDLYSENITYRENIQNVSESNVVLEVVQENQYGPTLRYYESVIYNKKLLTNNTNIRTFPFYNEKYMKIFNTVSDIDLEWLTKKGEIDYGYSGEYSAKSFVEFILKLMNEER
ncbi:hypothetical protein JEQ21_06365 [Streptococcus sp. 121]|uniref:hypothetical protein n=1 Tax=Streptococcus sp. 121 TaxID=2797637 RepID=UPI0018F07728|nr:hypothetical protein [Streptococcus sp. 121]MBJ6746079.1 hypothetical protein [Streptococcus sp. 121]